MSASRSNTISQNLALVLGGILCALLVAALARVPLKVAVVTFIGISSLFTLVFFKDKLKLISLCVVVIQLPLRTFIKSLLHQDYQADSMAIRMGLGVIDFLPLIILYGLWLKEIFFDRKSKLPTLSKLDLLILGYLAINVFSIVNADKPSTSIIGIFDLTRMLLLYFYVSRNIRQEEAKYVLVCLGINVLVQFALSGIQFHQGRFLVIALGGEETEYFSEVRMGAAGDFGGYVRADGTMTIPHALANYLGYLIPLFFSLTLCPHLRPAIRRTCGIVFLMGCVTVIFSFVRAAFVSIPLSCLSVMLYYIYSGRGKALRPLLILFLFLTPVMFLYSKPIFVRFFEAPEEMIAARFEVLSDPLLVLKKNPLLGLGIRNYVEGEQAQIVEEGVRVLVHNNLLYILCETGILGMISFAGLLVAVFIKGLQFWSHRNASLIPDLAVGILAGIANFVIQGFSDHVGIIAVFPMFWLMLGFLESLYRNESRQSTRLGSVYS